MDFLEAPLVIGIISYTIYKLFELKIIRRERLFMLEMLRQNPDFRMPAMDRVAVNLGRHPMLRTSLIFLGLGLGLLFGSLLQGILPRFINVHVLYEVADVITPAFVMIFGGLGMLASFIIENRISKKNKE